MTALEANKAQIDTLVESIKAAAAEPLSGGVRASKVDFNK